MSKILPIGSIVYLNEGNQKLMILNRGVTIRQNKQDVLFDYSAAIYPMGLNPNQLFYFNHEDVDRIVFKGYSNEEEDRFVELYLQWLEENKEKVVKGRTK